MAGGHFFQSAVSSYNPPAGYTPANAEVVAWASSTGITTQAVLEAVDAFVTGCKSDSIWTKFDAIYPFITDSADSNTRKTQFTYNLVNPATFTATFYGASSTYGYDGYTNGGSGHRMGTGFIPSTDADSSDFSIGIYTTTPIPVSDQVDFGSGNGGNYSYLTAGRSSTQQIGTLANNLQRVDNSANATTSTGLVHANLNISTQVRSLYSRGTARGSNGGSLGGGVSDADLSVGTFYYGGSILNASTKKYQFAFIGTFFDATQAADLNTRVDNLQTAIDAIYSTSRAVA
jgi:hypothetical protein